MSFEEIFHERLIARLGRLEAAGFPTIAGAVRSCVENAETDSQRVDTMTELAELVAKVER